MIEIKKGKEPTCLANLRQEAKENELSPKEAYELLPSSDKDCVRQNLLKDQGGLCAYCMSRIPRSDADSQISQLCIEHLIPLNPADHRDVGQGLDYNNLFLVCPGNQVVRGQSRAYKDLTCDAHKGNKEFRKINPCNKDTLASIYYNLDGTIDATDSDVAYDLKDTLNLNSASAPLIAERKASLDSLINELGNIDEENLLDYCQSVLTKFREETENKTPYVGILFWYLQLLISGLESQEL